MNSNKTKHLLDENELKKLKAFDSDLFIGQSYFSDDGAQLFLISQPIPKLVQHFLVFQKEPHNGNLRDCHVKKLSLLIQQIKVLLQNWYGKILK